MALARSIVFLALVGLLLGGCGKPDPINETHTGTLEDGDSIHPQDQSLYDEYKFKAAEGYIITINMTSDAVDSYLHLHGPNEEDVQDDDGAEEGNNARITHTATSSGEWTVWANTYDQGETGAYTLTIQTAAGQ